MCVTLNMAQQFLYATKRDDRKESYPGIAMHVAAMDEEGLERGS